MDFGIFTMFSTREGSTQQVAEDAGLDTLWLDREGHPEVQVTGGRMT